MKTRLQSTQTQTQTRTRIWNRYSEMNRIANNRFVTLAERVKGVQVHQMRLRHDETHEQLAKSMTIQQETFTTTNL